jgi:DNA-binding response OmpR family regulator
LIASSPAALNAGPPPQPCSSGREDKILIADDNRDAAESLALWLLLEGHQVVVAHDGPAAIKLAAQERPAAMLLDIGMPGLDGYEVARHVRRQTWGTSLLLVALTGRGEEDDRRRAWAAGFDGHFTKPIDPRVLAEFIRDRAEQNRRTSSCP